MKWRFMNRFIQFKMLSLALKHLNVLQGKQRSFTPSHRKKSSNRTKSCCPSCERQCRRMSMSWALSGRYQQIPFADSMSVTLLDLQSQLFRWSSPGAGSAGQQEAGTIPRLAVMCSLPLFCPQHKLTISEACGLKQPLGIALASKTLEVAQEKLRAEIYDQVNTCNMLLYQVKQRSRAQEQLQRRLQQQQDVQMDDKQHQAQVVRTLESNIEKMQTKVRAGQKVTALYLVVRDALRKVSSSSLCRCLTRSPCKGTEVPKGLCWWDTLLQEVLLLPSIFCPRTAPRLLRKCPQTDAGSRNQKKGF
ncbi:uncharacterized protein ACIB01_015423 [Guaruba guarouba]